IVHLLTDSRSLYFPETSLFFALKTKTNDGHRYIGDLYRRGVRSFVVATEIAKTSETSEAFETSEITTFNQMKETSATSEFKQLKGANFLVVKDVLKSLQQLATFHRQCFTIPVVGITGSNGKTVVKELLYQLIHTDFNIVRSPRSYNSQTGVPLSVWGMNEQHTLGIFEAGVSMPNEMDKLRPIISPTIGLITNIGEAHQKNFKSVAEKCIEKLLLFVDSEVIIYNADDEVIERSLEASCLSHKAVGWSRKNPEAALYVSSIAKGRTTTTLQCTMMGITHEYIIPFVDDAFIEDIIHCIAILFYLKPSEVMNKDEVFSNLEPVAMRLETKEGIRGCRLINDTYNSDFNSLSVALDFQLSRRADMSLRSTVILSDILQSGVWPEYLYSRVAELFRRKNVDRIIGIGKDIGSCAKVFTCAEKCFYTSTDAFLKAFSPQMFHDEMILIKGSRSFHFERITELLEKKVHETILEVNLDAVIHNFNHFRSLLKPSTRMVCMIKAFGYGVGAFETAKTLQDHRCDYLAVAVADEGEDLRKEGISIPIMVMNPEHSSFNLLFENALEPEVYNFRLLDALVVEAKKRGITSFPVHIKIDTGMHRLGFEPRDVPEICRRLSHQNGLLARSVFSHLAGSDSSDFDDFTRRQIDIFNAAAASMEEILGYPVIKHILNSAGIERFIEHQKDMVRLGISLYGVSASGQSGKLQCVCSLKTVILQIREVKAGDSIGYSRRTFVSRDSRIAIIPIGYADGLDRRLSNGAGEVLVNGVRCPIAGNICMDACMVDVTDIEAREGDAVIIFNERLTVNEIADRIGSIPYEILTSISPRVKRVYFRE
ncbi:MAG: bifunctional UDP-N-acetylmuramoyl-tripeptide:D-alanyl-D-alanine ligase/alanine racemase, partial [Tannerella sp.]|nr:bifunctional UDP-N-acetylmuramoyl-tripeptide:D-alanyl-D-alanine ligase/alanine racemase [Tannerella sp.]